MGGGWGGVCLTAASKKKTVERKTHLGQLCLLATDLGAGSTR